MTWGFPSGSVGKNPLASAGDTDLSADPEKSHILQSHNCWAYAQSLRAAPTEARAPQSEKPRQWEACAPQQRLDPLSTSKEKPALQQRPNEAKTKHINKA